MTDDTSIKTLQCFCFLAPFFAGLFYEPFACAASLFLIAFLFTRWRRQGSLSVPLSPLFFTLAILIGCSLLCILWATDKGMSIFGALKILPLPLFCLALVQLPANARNALFAVLPQSGALMTVTAFLLGQISPLHDYFFISNRLAGFFFYPNTFALYLLLGVLVLLSRASHQNSDWGLLIVLLAGIALSGSRSVFLLLILFLLFLLLHRRNRKFRIGILGCLTTLIVVTVLYAKISGDTSSIARYLTISLQSSTLQGRLLYLLDALPVIARHPLGLGYLGYAFTQGSFQTGVYSVTYIHNELFQLLLDLGWLPTLLCSWLLIRTMLSAEKNLQDKLLLTAILLHCLVDFDLQFPVIGIILVLVMQTPCQKVCFNRFFPAVSCLLAGVCLFFATVSGFYYTHHYAACTTLYPFHTNAQLAQLVLTEDAPEMNHISDKILRVNDSVSLAWSAKARIAFAQGKVTEMIRCKERALALSKYSLAEYLDYFQMLYSCYQLYLQNHDPASAEVCRQKILEIPQTLDAVLARTSPVAWRITDKPHLSLPGDYLEILQALQQ